MTPQKQKNKQWRLDQLPPRSQNKTVPLNSKEKRWFDFFVVQIHIIHCEIWILCLTLNSPEQYARIFSVFPIHKYFRKCETRYKYEWNWDSLVAWFVQFWLNAVISIWISGLVEFGGMNIGGTVLSCCSPACIFFILIRPCQRWSTAYGEEDVGRRPTICPESTPYCAAQQSCPS